VTCFHCLVLVTGVESSHLRDHVPVRPRIGRASHACGYKVGPVRQPDRGRAIAALPQDVGLAIAIEATFGEPAQCP
jgi:hypothetical protein